MNIKEVYFISKKNSSKDLAKGFIELYDDPALCKLIVIMGKDMLRIIIHPHI